MVQSQFSLSWDSYKNNICSGFSSLQQNGEFVDLTLAADGHFVKVHQVLLALASPYLKELMSSAPCQHPVVFLNNISFMTLSFLLEYIYTGEVLIPANHISAFVDAAKALHIKGLETVCHENLAASSHSSVSQNDETDLCYDNSATRLVSTKDSLGQINLPITARKISIKPEQVPDRSTNTSVRTSATLTSNTSPPKEASQVYSDLDDTGGVDDDDEEYCTPSKKSNTSPPEKPSPAINTNLQFTVSIRGSLQVILNRFMYNLNSTQNSGVKRWRCIDYRNKKCMAFLVTKGNIVLNRANLHSHSYHDKKILAKIEKNAVFSALDDAEGYKEKENSKIQEETATESEDYAFELKREMEENART